MAFIGRMRGSRVRIVILALFSGCAAYLLSFLGLNPPQDRNCLVIPKRKMHSRV